MQLSWISAGEWKEAIRDAGFEVERLYGWFDYRPYRRGEDMVFVARRLG
jgi:hypothetical protein